MRSFLVIITALTPAVTSHAAEIVLRDAAIPAGNIVRLGDVADVRAIDSARAERLASLPLMPTPAPATQQFIRRRQIEEMLISHGEELSAHRFGGASQVRLGKTRAPGTTARRSARRTFPTKLTSGTIRRARETVNDAIIDQLRVYASANEPWEVAFELTDSQLRRLAASDSPATVSGGRPPWTGQQRFILRFTTPDGPVQTPVVADVTLPPTVAVATQTIPRGTILRAADVEMRRVSMKQLRDRTSQRISRLEEIVGLETTRPIRAGQVLSRPMMRQPIVVRRGDSVTVFARAAGIQVRTVGQARENGGRGDLVVVETIEDRQRFTARVVGLREVEVLAHGVDAANYAPRRREAAPERTRRPKRSPRVADAEPFDRNPSPRNARTTNASPPPGADDAQDDNATLPARTADEAAQPGGLQWQAAKRSGSTDR